GREVGDVVQAEDGGHLGVLGQMLGEASVVEAEELLEDQAGQELGLREGLGAVDVAVGRDRLPGGVVRDLEDPARRFAGGHIHSTWPTGRRFAGLLQSSNPSFIKVQTLPISPYLCNFL